MSWAHAPLHKLRVETYRASCGCSHGHCWTDHPVKANVLVLATVVTTVRRHPRHQSSVEHARTYVPSAVEAKRGYPDECQQGGLREAGCPWRACEVPVKGRARVNRAGESVG